MKLIIGISVGLFLAVALNVFGLVLAGGGHGWVSPLWASCAAWVLGPTTGLFVLRPHPRGSMYLSAAMIACDVALAWSSVQEGHQYVSRAWHAVPLELAAWCVLWLLLHVAVGATVWIALMSRTEQ